MAYLFNDDKSKKYIDNDNSKWIKLTDISGGQSFGITAYILGKIYYKKVGSSVTLKFNLEIFNDDVPANTMINLIRLSDMPDDIKFEVDSKNSASYLKSSPILTIFDDKEISLTKPLKRCVVFFSKDYLRLIILDKLNFVGDSYCFNFMSEWTYNL